MLFVPGPGNFCLVHVSLVPVLNVVGEQVYLESRHFYMLKHYYVHMLGSSMTKFILLIYYVQLLLRFTYGWGWICKMQKTKPTQHSVRGLRGLGLTPNILACRSTKVNSWSFFVHLMFLQTVCNRILLGFPNPSFIRH